MLDKEEERKAELEMKALEGAAAECVKRFGAAAREHFVAYEGEDRVLGFSSKGLREIAQSRVNQDFRNQNLRQQAGFSAEVKSVARKNAENIIEGRGSRYVRTDSLGRINDPLFDVVEIDSSGTVIAGSQAQVKFVGNNPEELLGKLRSQKYKKYLENNAIIDIPDDYYDVLVGFGDEPGLIDNKIEDLDKQIEKVRERGKSEELEKLQSQRRDLQKIKKCVRKSGLSRGNYKDGDHELGSAPDEAMEARLHPEWSTAKDVIKIAHEAGKHQAKIGAVTAGSLSLIRNVVDCTRGEIAPEEAAENVVKDAGVGAVSSYAIAFSGTAIQGAMSNASSEYLRALSKTNLASGFVTTTVSVGKTMRKYFAGEIDGEQCIEELGEKGFGELGAAMYSAAALGLVQGAAPVAVKVVAGMAGSMLGYAAAVAVYQELVSSQREYRFAIEERARIEAECEEAARLVCQYRLEMQLAAEQYFSESYDVLTDGFAAIDNAIIEDDTDGFLVGNALIQKTLGRKPQFETQLEFDALMESDTPFQL